MRVWTIKLCKPCHFPQHQSNNRWSIRDLIKLKCGLTRIRMLLCTFPMVSGSLKWKWIGIPLLDFIVAIYCKHPHYYITCWIAGAPYTSKELIDLARKQNEVKFKNTRFPSAPFKTDSEKEKEPETPSTQSLNLIRGITEGKIGLDGKEVNVKTPSVNGFKYVRTPSPTPGKTLLNSVKILGWTISSSKINDNDKVRFIF